MIEHVTIVSLNGISSIALEGANSQGWPRFTCTISQSKAGESISRNNASGCRIDQSCYETL